ncbi:DNA topoisomerase IB [soil metagenome]
MALPAATRRSAADEPATGGPAGGQAAARLAAKTGSRGAPTGTGAAVADSELVTDPRDAARAARLRYVSDAQPGIVRRRAGKGFSYRGPDGELVKDRERLARIRRLAIPPAWSDVWICPVPTGHIQATGRDSQGRKQYRYHERWREVRNENKYSRTIAFAQALPRIRERVDQDLARRGLPREKVLAAVVKLLETTVIRVGNEEYARTNKSFGLTTMRDRHLKGDGADLRFRFRGKAGKDHDIPISDRRLARVVKRCQELPGQRLFQYLDDDGQRQSIDSSDVNDYLRETTGEDYTAKDFRTWVGTVVAAQALKGFEAVDSEAASKRNVVQAIEAVARQLGNTAAVCRSCYVHPAIIESYLDGSMLQAMRERAQQEIVEGLSSLRPEEAAVLALLTQRLTDSEAGAGAA